jgi:predicted phosphodiesterase
MKVLFVGDVHNHYYMFIDIATLDASENFDKIIFMGDYVDDWNTNNHQSLATLEKIFNLKESNPNKYVFLTGNHELSYLGYKCSGHQYELDDVMNLKLIENIDKLDFYTSIQLGDNYYICTHAGITDAFVDEYLGEKWLEKLKEMNSGKLNNLELLSKCGYFRGGADKCSSFLWADLREHKLFNNYPPKVENQIVGHTPVPTITLNGNICFIDTHSTYKDGKEYGDKSYLMWDEDKFRVIK